MVPDKFYNSLSFYSGPSQQKPDVLPVAKNEYLYRECGATNKYYSQAQGLQVPEGVLAHVKFSDKFKKGYYATQVEENGKVTKVMYFNIA